MLLKKNPKYIREIMLICVCVCVIAGECTVMNDCGDRLVLWVQCGQNYNLVKLSLLSHWRSGILNLK